MRDLVFYAIGIIINATLYSETRVKILDKGAIDKLIDVLKDANIEDMELSNVAAKALLNMTENTNYWVQETVLKLEEIL